MPKVCGQPVNRERSSRRKKGVHLSPNTYIENISGKNGSVKKVFIHYFIPQLTLLFSTHKKFISNPLIQSYTTFPQSLLLKQPTKET